VAGKSVQDWLKEGEELFNDSLAEIHELETQLAALEEKLAAKQGEVNKLAGIIGRPAVEGRKVLKAEIIPTGVNGNANGNGHSANGNGHPANGSDYSANPSTIPNSPATIARALQGRGLGR
jgi:hypothetical protein